MPSLLSVYWAPQHKAERPGDIEFIRQLRPYDVLILEPDVQDIIDAHNASPESEIVLRYWWLDDGRTASNPQGIYKQLREAPAATAWHFVNFYKDRINEIVSEARARGCYTLRREQLVAHGINEPDTNDLAEQINIYTEICCQGFYADGTRFEALNFATGHPVQLRGGPGSDVNWALYRRALDAIQFGDHYAVTHEYYNDLGLRDPSLYPWHIGRGDKWMPGGCKRKIGEFGFEMLVNGRLPHHHGWQGFLQNDQYVADIDWYLSHVRDDVLSVRIF